MKKMTTDGIRLFTESAGNKPAGAIYVTAGGNDAACFQMKFTGGGGISKPTVPCRNFIYPGLIYRMPHTGEW
jgi:hypothetical protein